jgi:UDP-2,4-diacetamido-2,4,6-trideoxy-beta-L-altropyranose hydrolase
MIKKKKFLFITVASNTYGYGHLNRSLSLKFFFKKKFAIKIINFTDKKIKNFPSFFFHQADIILNQNLFYKFDKIILDISNKKIFKEKKFIKVLSYLTKKFKSKVVLIDSIGGEMLNNFKEFYFSILICPYFFNKRLIFKKRKNVQYFIGEKFTILPSCYKNIKIKLLNKKIKNLMISCGGSDQNHNTIKILKFLEKLEIRLNINVAIGPFFSKNLVLKIKNFKKISFNKINIFRKHKNLSKIISNSQIAFISSGLTKYETASVGLPSIVFCENKKQFILNQGYKKKNIALNIGMINNLNKHKKNIVKLIHSLKELKKLHVVSKATVDFNGPSRIINLLEKN